MLNIFDKLKAAEAARREKLGETPSIPPEQKALSDKLNKPAGSRLIIKPQQPAPAETRPVVSHGANFQPARQVPMSMSSETLIADLSLLDELEEAEDDPDETEEFGEMAEINLEENEWVSTVSAGEIGESLGIQTLETPQPQTLPSSPKLQTPSDSITTKRLTLPQSLPPTAKSEPPKTPVLSMPTSPTTHSLRLPVNPLLRHPPSNSPPPVPSVSQPQQPADVSSTKSVSSQDAALIAAGGPLGKLLQRKYETPNQVVVSAGAASCIAAGDAVITPKQFLEEWNELGDDPDLVEDLNGQRQALLQKVAARLRQIFDAEVDRLTTPYANELALQELGQLVRLTFIRVKEAPSAWATLDLLDKSAVIQAMVAMAVKRNSAVKNRKPAEAKQLSSSMETMIVGEGDVMAAFDEVFSGIDFEV